MAGITLEQLEDVVVHLSDEEFEELVEAWEQAARRSLESQRECHGNPGAGVRRSM